MKFIPHIRLSGLLIGHNMSLIMPYVWNLRDIWGSLRSEYLKIIIKCSLLKWGIRKMKQISCNTINTFELQVLLYYYFNSAWENMI